MGRKNIKNARIVNNRDRKRSLNGRDWLAKLNFRVDGASENSGNNNAVNYIDNQNIYIEKLKQKFPNLFTTQGKMKTIKNTLSSSKMQ